MGDLAKRPLRQEKDGELDGIRRRDDEHQAKILCEYDWFSGPMRAIFDVGEIGVILIGIPGLEKKLARYPQFYSRIGFVHEFRPLAATEVRELLDRRWAPPGVCLPQQPLDAETVAAIIRIAGGNFRLLNRLLTQIERILEINALQAVTKEAVEAARESLVIGQT